MSQYRIDSQVGGVFGPSEQEKTEASLTLKVLCTSYLNSMSLQRQMNKAMRTLSESAAATQTTGSADYKSAMAALKVTAEDASSIAHNSLSRLQAISKKDPGIWDTMDQVAKAISEDRPVNVNVKTGQGTQITVQTGTTSIQSQVGFEPISTTVIIVVVIAITIISAAVIAVVLTQSNRDYSAAVQKRQSLFTKTAAGKLKIAEEVRKAGEDLAAQRITREQYDAKVNAANQSLAIINQAEAGLPALPEKPADPFGQIAKITKYIVPVVIIGGIGFAAYKIGLFDVAKKQIKQRGWA